MILYVVGGLVALLVFLRLLLASPAFRGNVGEGRIARDLTRSAEGSNVVLNDLLLSTENGTCQIDHLLISTSGIFVIETKNFSGWIHGAERSSQWTQTIYRASYKFGNPVTQNWGHVASLRKLLSDFPDLHYSPIVVFSGSAELKNVYCQTPVIYRHQLLETIKSVGRENSLSREQIPRIVERILANVLEGKASRKAHTAQVRFRMNVRTLAETARSCSQCGGRMVERSGKYGRFYGCSNYPRCRKTIPL